MRPPRFLENPCARALLSDPDGNYASYGAQSHGPRTRCLRFVVAVARTRRKTRSQVGGQPFLDGTYTRKALTKGFSSCILLSQALPGAIPRLCLAQAKRTHLSNTAI
jgi:hypothetical protein